jgi:hypothetical protein
MHHPNHMIGMHPYYMMMHPGMPMIPHPHIFTNSHLLHKQELDDPAIQRAIQSNS